MSGGNGIPFEVVVQGEGSRRLEELWVTVSDRAALIDSKTVALFNVVAATDKAILDRFYGEKLLSFRMVGLSSRTSLAFALLFLLLADMILPGWVNPSPMGAEFTRPAWIIVGVLVVLMLPALKTTARIAVVPTLLPIGAFTAFWVVSRLTHDSQDRWSTVVDSAMLLSVFSDVAVTTVIRRSIAIIGRQVRIGVVVLMLGLQALCIAVFSVLPVIVAFIVDEPGLAHRHSDTSITLFIVAAMNVTTVLLSLAFSASGSRLTGISRRPAWSPPGKPAGFPQRQVRRAAWVRHSRYRY